MRLARIGDTGGECPEQPLSVQRFASVIRLRPEKEAEYRVLHADAWPGVLAKLREVHIRNYSIYLRDGILFSYLEYDGDDYDADMAAMPRTLRQSAGGSSPIPASSLSTAPPTGSDGRRWRRCSTLTELQPEVRIDAHHHVWDLAVRDQPWTADIPALRRTFTFEELRPQLADAGISATVLVQTITVAEETPEFLALAEESPEIRGVVAGSISPPPTSPIGSPS